MQLISNYLDKIQSRASEIFNNNHIACIHVKTNYKGVEIEISDETANMSAMSESEHEHVEHEHVEHEHVEHEHLPSHSRLIIAGKNVHLVELTDGTFKSHEFPYTKGKSKLELAKNLIDYVPEYGGKAYNRNP